MTGFFMAAIEMNNLINHLPKVIVKEFLRQQVEC